MAIKLKMTTALDDPDMAVAFCDFISNACNTSEGGNLYRPTMDWLKQENATLYLAIDVGTKEIVAGVVSYQVREGVAALSAMYTAQKYRKYGYARLLIAKAIGWAKLAGFDRVEVEVRYYSSGVPVAADALYMSFGFKPFGQPVRYKIDHNERSIHLLNSAEPDETFRSQSYVLHFEDEVRCYG